MASPFKIFFKTILLTRKSGQYINGLWVKGAETTTSITADVQSVKVNQMATLPEGRRIDDFRILYTETLLKSVDTDGALNPDIVQIDSVRFEVLKVYDWGWRLNHYKVLIGKSEQSL